MGMRGYKTELDLNNVQITACKKHAGCSRFAYNWGLARKQEARAAGNRMPSAMELHKELNALKASDYPWMYECSKGAPQEALMHLDHPLTHFFLKSQPNKQLQLHENRRYSHSHYPNKTLC